MLKRFLNNDLGLLKYSSILSDFGTMIAIISRKDINHLNKISIMKTATNFLLTTLIVLIASSVAWAQTADFTLDEANSSIVIAGTSTIHDWEADVEEMSTNISLAPEMITQDSMANPVNSFSLTVPVEQKNIRCAKRKRSS
jgi:hypothetical protein